MKDSIKNLTWNKTVLKSSIPVIVNFSAYWCNPCHLIIPILEKIARKYKEMLRVIKIDVDKTPEIARKYEVRALPTLLFFKEGQVVDRRIGVLSTGELEKRVKELLNLKDGPEH